MTLNPRSGVDFFIGSYLFPVDLHTSILIMFSLAKRWQRMMWGKEDPFLDPFL